MAVQVVWFKRDLRVEDHAPLLQASRRGPCVALYVYEPEILNSAEFDSSHLVFINQCLASLERSLARLGGRLVTRVGRMPDVLDEIDQALGIEAIWSHQETGNAITFARDRRVARWAARRGVVWHEFPQDGVVRRLKSRDGWAGLWNEAMRRPPLPAPRALGQVSGFDPGSIQEPSDLHLPPSRKTEAQRGGDTAARSILASFLDHRGADYPRGISSPSEARRRCSRLSPHLALGTLSTRQVNHAILEARRSLDETQAEGGWVDPRRRRALRAFQERLRWRGHFMQKLEDEPEIEFRNFSRALDGLREGEFDRVRFEAWASGTTGYPLVDACMRALHWGGWVNFRMRAMLMSFASYHLWLHWRPTSVYLARHFLDFEPGIHFPQAQMQSGTTGINTLRIYSPAKQVEDHDPQGLFIRRYVPELEGVPDAYLAEPHKMPPLLQKLVGCVIGRDYPQPIVDHSTAYKLAHERMDRVKKTPEAQTEAKRVLQKHGSRGKRRA